MGKKLELRDLRISFRTENGDVQAERGIDFSLETGKTLAIVGESGSGKSVTSKAILGILPGNARVDGGEILLEGQNLLNFSEEALCAIRGKRIAMVFQDPLSCLNPIVRVGRQITEVMLMKNRERKMTRAQARQKAIALMEEVGIPNPELRFGQYPFQLSGGMRQRIVIAIALAADPEILICDEPTTALDVTIQTQIMELLNRLKQQRQLSMIFITHDLGVVANVADEIGVMYAGKIVKYGTAEGIFYDPRHPYTWALLSSMPDLDTEGVLETIPGTPPNMIHPPVGDAFAQRNKYAMKIDFQQQPPMFRVSPTHQAATWLLHPNAPKVQMPEMIANQISRMKQRNGGGSNG